jgi:beta-phosphoglucomutase
LEPENCVVFEDAQAGIEAAINAGMHTIAVGDSETLSKAEKRISSINDFQPDLLNF